VHPHAVHVEPIPVPVRLERPDSHGPDVADIRHGDGDRGFGGVRQLHFGANVGSLQRERRGIVAVDDDRRQSGKRHASSSPTANTAMIAQCLFANRGMMCPPLSDGVPWHTCTGFRRLPPSIPTTPFRGWSRRQKPGLRSFRRLLPIPSDHHDRPRCTRPHPCFSRYEAV